MIRSSISLKTRCNLFGILCVLALRFVLCRSIQDFPFVRIGTLAEYLTKRRRNTQITPLSLSPLSLYLSQNSESSENEKKTVALIAETVLQVN